MAEVPNNETREQILAVAENLFSSRGYSSVTLRDIASAVGMKHASLYYYAPGGKEQLYVEVMERNFHKHEAGLNQAINQAGPDLREQMYAVTEWLTSQPPLDFARMSHADMPAISEKEAYRLMELAYNALRLPIVAALERAKVTGQIEIKDLNLAAMGLVSLIQSVHGIPFLDSPEARIKLGKELSDMLLFGWLKR
jgi:AcrR family transcriptional regulator